jgi:hypothetical protein
MRVCETCKHRSDIPPEYSELATLVSRFFPKVFYCSLLQVLKVYDPSSPAKVFSCELYEGVAEGEAKG